MMSRHLETVSVITPFGTRFMDAVLKMPITDGLRVIAYPSAAQQRRQIISSNSSGAFVLHDGPGLHDFLYGSADDHYWNAIQDVDKISYTFEVVDTRRRFLPCRFTVKLPHRGLYTPDCLRAPLSSNPLAGVPLYSTTARPLPPGTVVMRAQLWNHASSTPAAFVLVEALEGTLDGDTFVPREGAVPQRGISDASGGLALILPVPQPDLMKPATERLKWLFDVQAFFQPWGASSAPSPDLCDLMGQSRTAVLLSTVPAIPLKTVTLELGHELILKTSGPAEPSAWLHLVPS